MTSFSPNGSPAGILISPPTLDLCVGLLGFRMDVGVELLLAVVPTKDKMFCKSTRAARSCTFLTLPRRPALASNFWTTSERSHGNLPSQKTNVVESAADGCWGEGAPVLTDIPSSVQRYWTKQTPSAWKKVVLPGCFCLADLVSSEGCLK